MVKTDNTRKHWTRECSDCTYRRREYCYWGGQIKKLLTIPASQWRQCSLLKRPLAKESRVVDKSVYAASATEAAIKRACEERLQIRQNMGELLYLRLNSGDMFTFYPRKDGKVMRYRVKGCPKGTLDIFVLKDAQAYFFETKRPGEDFTKEQRYFCQLVREQGGIAAKINSVKEMDDILDGKVEGY